MTREEAVNRSWYPLVETYPDKETILSKTTMVSQAALPLIQYTGVFGMTNEIYKKNFVCYKVNQETERMIRMFIIISNFCEFFDSLEECEKLTITIASGTDVALHFSNLKSEFMFQSIDEIHEYMYARS